MKKSNILIALFIIFGLNSLFANIPAGYYQSANNKAKQDLITALNNIISNGYFLSYGSGNDHTWEGFNFTDRDTITNIIIDRYSNESRSQSGFNSVDGMHIEHALPKSWWGGSQINAYKDLHNLFPADGITNINKSNLPLGIVGEASFDNGVSKIGESSIIEYSGRCFEPADEYKGDFARSYFYVVTAYNEQANNWASPMLNNNEYPVFNKWTIDLLLAWHRQDPVSNLEIERNNNVYNIQHNRNPFIDFPQIAEHIWGNDTATLFSLPAETNPYLAYPNQWTSLPTYINLVNTTVDTTINFIGGNISSSTNISLKNNNPNIVISKNTITASEINNGCDITISISTSIVSEIIDTLIVTNAQIATIQIPIHALFTDEFMALNASDATPSTANINWMEVPNSSQYEVSIETGMSNIAGDLIIASYIEGSGWNKAIEIFNATGQTIDLSHYSIKKQSNGIGNFSAEYKLSGQLANNSSLVLVHSLADATLKNLADVITGSDQSDALAFNGNDAVALFHNGTMIDIVGAKDQTTAWGEDITLIRKSEVIHPINLFIPYEWSTMPQNHFSHLKTRTNNTANNATISTQICTSNNTTITNLTPNTQYTYSVKAIPSNRISVNKVRFSTTGVTATEAFNATDIFQNQFRANWDIAADADNYILSVFTLTGSGTTNVSENFDNIGSNGKPLPDGWDGTASGNYSSSTSTGVSPNSIALKNSGEYIQTGNYSSPIQNLTFMYRFPSGSSDGYLLLEGLDQNNNFITMDTIKALDNKKHNVSYPISPENIYSLKWTYIKTRGNCSIDDIAFSYSDSDTTIIESATTKNNSYIVYGLQPSTTYYYNVTVEIQDSLSEASNTVSATTNNIPTNNLDPSVDGSNIFIINNENIIRIENLNSNSNIEIFNTNGVKVFSKFANSNIYEISTANMQKGVYIIKVSSNENTESHKVII